MLERRDCRFYLTVHPHGRGDNLFNLVSIRRRVGSPPRAWGQCCAKGRITDMPRFTPTGVGTMWLICCTNHLPSVHPHGRGDNWCRILQLLATVGSPPRAWGQSLRAPPHSSPHRFTPTGVGTMNRPPRESTSRTVHPHGRGDNNERRADSSARYGSPPRAWGQSPQRQDPDGVSRFTPTGVGTISRFRARCKP